MSEWQPISTLPKPIGELTVVFQFARTWEQSFGAHRDYVEQCEIWFACNDQWCQSGTGHGWVELDPDDRPIRWMPLPKPPGEA